MSSRVDTVWRDGVIDMFAHTRDRSKSLRYKPLRYYLTIYHAQICHGPQVAGCIYCVPQFCDLSLVQIITYKLMNMEENQHMISAVFSPGAWITTNMFHHNFHKFGIFSYISSGKFQTQGKTYLTADQAFTSEIYEKYRIKL